MSLYSTESLIKGASSLGIELTKQQTEQFIQYYTILIEWNKVMNLTGITEYEEVIVKHFLDSIAVVKVCDMEKVKRVIDIGTGAGFPGIPLAIVFPHLQVVLLDSLKKRINFLEQVIGDLNLSGVKTIHGRAEDYANQKDYREKFDLSVSRAVANLSSLSEYCLPFTVCKGRFISYKSGKIDEELKVAQKAVQILGGKLVSSEKFHLPGTEMERSFVIIEKCNKTPRAYPRKAGLPGKDPIC